MPEPSLGATTALAAQLVADQSARDSLFFEWLNGSPEGGPQGDGRYPLPTPAGLQLVPCWAAVCAPLTGPAVASAQSAAQADTSASSAAAFASSAETAKAACETLVAEAQTLRTQLQSLLQQAASEHAAARAEREACQQLKADMQALLEQASSSP